MRKRGDGEQRGETESRELRGRRRAKIKKKNGRESLGFFHLKLKLKRCILHLFFIIIIINLNFCLNRQVSAPVRLESAYFGGFDRYDQNRETVI